MVGLRFFVVVFCVIACIAPVRAATSPVFNACSAKAMTQTAMTTCAAEELTRAEHGLHVVYAKLTRTLAGHPESIARIRAAQNAWIAYRDAYLEAMYPAKAKQVEYGSVYPMEADLDLADLTRQQTIALTHLLKAAIGCHNSNGGCVHPSLK
jgi:uncharacterized protein YecT (DUF1311 family)